DARDPASVAAATLHRLCYRYRPQSQFGSQDCWQATPPAVRVLPPPRILIQPRVAHSKSTPATRVETLATFLSQFHTSPAFASESLQRLVSVGRGPPPHGDRLRRASRPRDVQD